MENLSKSHYLQCLTELSHLQIEAYKNNVKKNAINLDEVQEKEKSFHRQSVEAIKNGVFLPLEYLFQSFELDKFERHCVVMSLMPEINKEFGEIYFNLQEEESKQLTIDLAIKLYLDLYGVEETPYDYVPYFARDSILATLFFQRQEQNSYMMTKELKLTDRIVGFILNEEFFSCELSGLAELWIPDYSEEDSSNPKQEKADSKICVMQKALRADTKKVIYLYGPRGSGKKALVRAFAKQEGISIIFVKKLTYYEGTLKILSDIQREAIISQSIVCFEDVDSLAIVGRYIQEHGRSIVSISSKATAPISTDTNYQFIPISFNMPDELQRIEIWREEARKYVVTPDIDFNALSNKFSFTVGQIIAALEMAKSIAILEDSNEIDEKILYSGCRSILSYEVDNNKIVKVKTTYIWSDLILPSYSKDLLRQACNQVANYHTVYNRWGFREKLPYGRGLSMLFAGPPGTGKTMGAQVVANHLNLNLYKVNLAGIVSKYIGETEKNLQEIFEVATDNQAVLFFDEADVLFSKRTEIKDSNDKYSNMEAAFMLQKIEEYNGICILATNYIQNFDEAFKRRLKFIIDFPFPDVNYRKLLWQTVFPRQTPLGADIDWNFLAKSFELSGSNIKNIAVNAAFEAAHQDREVSMTALLQATKHECAKNGKHISRAELGEYYLLLEKG